MTDPAISEQAMSALPNAQELKAQQEQLSAMEEQRQMVLEQVLEPSARERLNRVKLVRAEKAARLENQIIQMATSGKLTSKVSEDLLIKLLEGDGSGQEKKTSVVFKRRQYFDEDDDDNDDDLL